MKHTYLITSEQKAPLAEFIEAGRDFLGPVQVEFTDMTFVTTESDLLASILDKIILRDVMLNFLDSAKISPTSEEGRAVEQSQPDSVIIQKAPARAAVDQLKASEHNGALNLSAEVPRKQDGNADLRIRSRQRPKKRQNRKPHWICLSLSANRVSRPSSSDLLPCPPQ